MVTFGGFLFILVFAVLGAWRGALRFVAAFLALLVAGLLGRPLYFLTGWLVAMTGAVPRLFIPVVGGVLTGIVLFLVLMVPLEMGLRRRERRRLEDGLPARESWESVVGLVLGGAWGLCLLLLVCLGISSIARVDRAMRTAQAEVDFRAARRQTEQKRAQRLARLNYTKAPEINLAVELQPVEIRELKVPPPADSRLDAFNTEVERSVFAPVVERINVVDNRREELLRDLAVVVGDPVLFDRLQSQPKVLELARHPRFQALASDPAVAQAVREGRFRDLLDDEKVGALAQDQELRARLEALDVAQLLKQVKGP